MESVIYDDSPLANYLEGHGEAEGGWMLAKADSVHSSDDQQSFAPRGRPSAYFKSRRKLPEALKLDIPQATNVVTCFRNACSIALNSRLGRNNNAQFLERFRYIVIASQLLNDHANSIPYNTLTAVHDPISSSGYPPDVHDIQVSWVGISVTAGVAFALAWCIHWARTLAQVYSSKWGSSFTISMLVAVAIILYVSVRRQWLLYVRREAISSVNSLVSHAQGLDAAIAAAITLIQEVELVSRGYRLSSPLPPISRLEEVSQTRRCASLRRTLKKSLSSMLLPYVEGYKSLRPLATEVDLEKYYDIYEITQSDVDEIDEIANGGQPEPEDPEALKSLKILFQRFQIVRKLFLCSLLALDADGSKPDFPRWVLATSIMNTLSSVSATATTAISSLLPDTDRFPHPSTPKPPLTPNRERVRAQMRKVGILSQGIRALQAKMHILREESDRALDASTDVSELGNNMLVQYDSIGADLKLLMQEWEEGRAALANNIDRNERRISLSSAGMLLSRSATPNSLGGLTAVGEGSPGDALKALNRERGDSRERMSGESLSEEEIFEAVALPRQRSTLTREERLQKMKEERLRAAVRREEKDAGGSMLRELESVIKLRPRGRTTGRLPASVS